MMKTSISAAALALALSAGSALAADLPSHKAPPPVYVPPPVLTWTGFYVGLNAGYTWTDNSRVDTFSTPSFGNAGLGCGLAGQCPTSAALAGNSILNANSDGFIGGGQIGYNFQWNALVAGIEADIAGIADSKRSVFGLTSSGPVAGFPGNSYVAATRVSRSVDYLGTVRGRLGWAFTPTLLAYGTGGLAYGGVNHTVSVLESITGPAFVTDPFFGGANFSDTRVGWTAGGGVEWMFLPNWSAKAEYLYYDLGHSTSNFAMLELNGAGVPFVGTVLQSRTRYNGHIVRAGVNYHFNWAPVAPVLAKY